ncbi:Alpha/beta knot methyltransferase [Annulohypoxylon maeteangense]|uniref:Alpha/beta knot methyltransferase n=1 Tax=Annulohypoxylon maeteangense TaxID=1927788 RepID=UPI0020080073|nr:Alpha/beta knot methyltransferase [Annulohypoxylon maeteangense]KAI0881701.1 Alpha/beta knot methyltransferase [Annulohypoxylon maeteangense]
MISFNSSCLRCRPHILLRSQVSLTPINVLSRASSLSAIHRGLRNSEKSRPQGFNKSSLTPTGSRSSPSNRPDFKIRKGKKLILDEGPKPKSRQARFYDPDDSFGKKSLVYKLKAGSNQRGKGFPAEKSDRLTPEQFMNTFLGGSDRSSARSTPGRTFDKPSDRSFDRSSGRRDFTRVGSDDRPTRNEWGNQEDQENKREERNFQSSREPQNDEEDQHPAVRRIGLKDHDKGPIRIPRTTAASQFLYGRSVVDAVLRKTTRQIYKLYLYCGENRQDISQTAGLERQATRAGIPVVQVIDSDGLRRMDKMSEGRPHNGCILEASPLPQLPVKHLGALAEKGFHVMLNHQSVEEAQINGTDDFIRCDLPANRKPFILLLDRIQDPGNLGSILRTAAFLGVNAIGITKGHSATLNSIASKASAGASEVMKLFSVDSILNFLTRSKENDWVVYAAVAPTGRPKGGKHLFLDRVDTYDPLSTSPTILVVGSEGEGLTKDTRRLADYEVSIPNNANSPLVESLNVGVATGILCSAFLKNQHSGGQFDKILEINEKESESESDALWN